MAKNEPIEAMPDPALIRRFLDGESVLTEKGALRLLRSQSSGGTLRLDVMRGDRRIVVDLRGDVKRDE